MGICVSSGAVIQCSFGAKPSKLTVLSPKVMTKSSVATIADSKPLENFTSFGMCSSLGNPAVSAATTAALGVLTPQPCTPNCAGMWVGDNLKVMSEGKPILTNTDTLACMFGGVIKIVNPNNTNVIV